MNKNVETVILWSVRNLLTHKTYRVMARSKWEAISQAVRIDNNKQPAGSYIAISLQ